MSAPIDQLSARRARKPRISLSAALSAAQIRTGISKNLCHLTNLMRLLPISAAEIRENTRATAIKIVSHLRSALRQERQRGRAGHWTYDLNRHIALYQALKIELQLARRK